MSHKFFIFFLLLVTYLSLNSANSNEFLIGTYSHYKQLANDINLPVDEVANDIAQIRDNEKSISGLLNEIEAVLNERN